MKQLKLAVMALLTFATVSNVIAQDADNPWAVGFGVNAVDYRTQKGGVGDIAKDFVGPNDWIDNIIPSISRITVARYLDKGFSLEFDGSINKVKTMVTKNDVDLLYYRLGLGAKYDLNNLLGETGWFDPYIGLGGAFQNIGEKSGGVITGLAGFNTWFNDNLGLNFHTSYNHHFGPNDFFQHAIGLVFKFGGKDTDGDGIYDKYDECPEVPGLKEFNGCPDTDGDGIPDKDDECPEVPGLKEFNGCPDTDGDGIPDHLDKCPEVAGLKEFDGCPDTDGDGIPDNLDKCPEVAGPKENNGCPWPDTDGDGVLDKDDKCPNVPGPASNQGCPVKKVTEKVAKQIGDFAREIFFNSGRDTFRPGVTERLDKIVKIMKEFKDSSFSIEGHTDSQGRKANNQRLSERRAKAVLDYLVKQGISTDRLKSVGYGEDYPIASNRTRAGRAQNRRVEIKAKN